MLSIVGILSGWLFLVAPAARNPAICPGQWLAAAGPAWSATGLKTGGPTSADATAPGLKTGGPAPEEILLPWDFRALAREPDTAASDRVAYSRRRDVAITLVAGTAWIVSEIEKQHLAPSACRWCDEPLNGLDAWGREHLRWEHTSAAATLSTVTGFVAAPALAYGLDWAAARHDDRESSVRADVVLITQSVSIAADVTQLLKFTTGRQRPYLRPPFPPELANISPADDNTSFPSGHTTLAFSAITSSAEIAALRGYRWAPWIWKAGLPVAVLTAYFRVAADRHYLTDVLAGAGVGSAVGFAVPSLGHRTRGSRLPSITIAPSRFGGRMVAAQWLW